MRFLEAFLSKINSLFWGGPMLLILCLFHLYFTIHTGGVQKQLLRGIRCSVSGGDQKKGSENGTARKNSPGTGSQNNSSAPSHRVSGLMALTTTLAATLGTGNIIGVSSAIYLGGPGARASSAWPHPTRNASSPSCTAEKMPTAPTAAGR